MAALTSAGVTVHETWKEGGTSSRRFLAKEVTLVLASQGGATNNIPAALFGMRKIVDVRAARKTDDNGTSAFLLPSIDGALVHYHATLGGAPGDVTADIRCIVVGYD